MSLPDSVEHTRSDMACQASSRGEHCEYLRLRPRESGGTYGIFSLICITFCFLVSSSYPRIVTAAEAEVAKSLNSRSLFN